MPLNKISCATESTINPVSRAHLAESYVNAINVEFRLLIACSVITFLAARIASYAALEFTSVVAVLLETILSVTHCENEPVTRVAVDVFKICNISLNLLVTTLPSVALAALVAVLAAKLRTN